MAPPDVDTIPFYSTSEYMEPRKDTEYKFPLAPVRNVPTKVMEIDQKSKDNKVCRDNRMIRLTGKYDLKNKDFVKLMTSR